jgi:hypothetical protein
VKDDGHQSAPANNGLFLYQINHLCMIRILFFALLFIGARPGIPNDDFCGISNKSFTHGERILYKVHYSVIGIYVDAGDASFTVDRTIFGNKPVYHLTGLGTSNPRYDWIFKVRDRYESYIDTGSLRPYHFKRDVYEGGYAFKENVTFDQARNQAETKKGRYNVPACVQDVLSAIYYARNIDFDKYKPGDKIPFNMFIDEEVHPLFIRYMGREVIKTRYGRYNAIKFSPMLISGTIFSGGEKMLVWVSDDKNHVPLRIESPITVGSVKVDMKGYSNLRYPLSCRLSGI